MQPTHRQPRVISTSGGESSGVLAQLELRAGIGPDDYFLFANTGLEDNRTLDFLHQQELYGLPLRWLQYCRFNGWKEVNYATAARVDWASQDADYLRAALAATPFWQLIMAKYLTPGPPRQSRRERERLSARLLAPAPAPPRQVLMLPNVVSKFCTQELKIRVMRDFMRSQGYGHWQMVQGLRADEMSRVAKGRANRDSRWDNVYPLVEAGIRKPDVGAYWARQPYRLGLHNYEGNCRYCFEKSADKLQVLTDETPLAAEILGEMEEATRTTFILNVPLRYFLNRVGRRDLATSRAALLAHPALQASCFCGD